MNKYLKIGMGVILFAALLAVSMMAYNKLSKGYEGETNMAPQKPREEDEQQDEKVMARDAVIEDVQRNPVSLLSLIEQPVVINFWASWCGPCKSEMPDFQKIYEKYGDRVTFVMINLTDGKRETREDGASYIEKMGFTFPVYYDKNQEAASTYYVQSIPTTFFLKGDGEIVVSGRGALDEDKLEEGIAMILEE